MDPRLLKHVERELHHVRRLGGEFAKEFPKVAGRLGLDEFECADPYVERLLEGLAYLAGRVQVELEAQFPQFTRQLLQIVYPNYLAPIPSMAVVRFEPDPTIGDLTQGVSVPRHTTLRSLMGKGDQVNCVYETAHPVTLWPLEIADVRYLGTNLVSRRGAQFENARAALRILLRTTIDIPIASLPLDSITFFLRGDGNRAIGLYEQLFARCVGLYANQPSEQLKSEGRLPRSSIRRVGFAPDEGLLPYCARSFEGYRLLHEYFAMPQRFLFAEIGDLRSRLRSCPGRELEVVAVFDRAEPWLENSVERSDIELFCTPVVNLFRKRSDRIHLTHNTNDYHIVPDRSVPMDFEVYDALEVEGYGEGELLRTFHPLYQLKDATGVRADAYYTLRREPRLLSERQRRVGARSSYIGSEVFVSLVDSQAAPYSHELRQLGLTLLCTNRDLPLQMPVGMSDTDFTLDVGAPIRSTRCVAGPTRPRPGLAYAEGDSSWRLINHLALNYHTLSDTDPREGAAALRALLRLYVGEKDYAALRQVDGVRFVRAVAQTRRLPIPGPIVFGRALEITVSFEEAMFEGSGIFLLGAVLDHFFSKYVSLNSMTETVIRAEERGEVMRWPVRTGKRHTF